MRSFVWMALVGGLWFGLGGEPVVAQSTADAYFHDAAQQYVAGNRGAARQTVARGLEVAPSDPRLQALQKKLEQEDGRQGGGQQSSSQGAPDERRTSSESRSRRRQSGESGRERESQAQQSAANRSSSRSNGQSARHGDRERQDGGGNPGTGGERRRVHGLSRAQAARLLQALETQEMKLLREVQARAEQGATVEKDW